MKLYHGSPIQGITEFEIENPRFEPVEGTGVYLTPKYSLARGYAGSEGAVYICEFKTNAIFDATNKNEFIFLFQKISKKIKYNIMKLNGINETINGLFSGQYQITDESSSGVTWQLRNLLLNDEIFNELPNADDKLETMKSEVKEYFEQHPILKYNDKTLGLIYVCRNPSVLKIVGWVDVGSKEDTELL